MNDSQKRSDPGSFQNPHTKWNRVYRLIWGVVACLLTLTPPRLGWPLRKCILQAFGAKIGNSWLHSKVRIWAPNRLIIGDDTYIDRGVYLYNPWVITIGDRTVISFDTLICSPSHDFRQKSLPLIGEEIMIKDDVWVAAQCIVGPGVVLEDGVVLGAGSVLFRGSKPWTIWAGNPAQMVGVREIA